MRRHGHTLYPSGILLRVTPDNKQGCTRHDGFLSRPKIRGSSQLVVKHGSSFLILQHRPGACLGGRELECLGGSIFIYRLPSDKRAA